MPVANPASLKMAITHIYVSECPHLPKAVSDTPYTLLIRISISMLRQCHGIFFNSSIFVVGSHIVRPWEAPDPAPRQAPIVPQPALVVPQPAPVVPLLASNDHQHDPDPHQQAQNAQLFVPETHQNAPNGHQPDPDAPQQALHAQLPTPDTHQQAPNGQLLVPETHQNAPNGNQPAPNTPQPAQNAQLPTEDTHQQAPHAQLPAPDAHQQVQNAQLPTLDEHQPAQMAPQPPQNSSPLNPYSQYPIHGAGPMNFYMHALGAPGSYFPFHQSMPVSTVRAPTYLPWTASMHPPLPAPPQNPHFPVPPAPWNPGLHPQTAPGYPQQPTYPVPPTPPLTVKAQHGILLEEISKLCRKTGSQWIVAISEDYMKQVQRVDKHRANALKQRPGDNQLNAHYDQQRLQIISQTQTQLQAYRDSEISSITPRTSTDATAAQGTSKDARNKARTKKESVNEDTNDDIDDDNNADTDSSEDETDSEPNEQPNDDNAASTRTTRFSSKTKQVLETWYVKHLNKPYAGSDVKKLAKKAGITEKQVKKWLSNRRTRDKNTRSRKQDNGGSHPQYHKGGPGYHPYWQ